MFLTNQNSEEALVVACILLFRKMRHQSNPESIFPHLGENNGGVLSMRTPARVQPLLGAERKGEFRDWTRVGLTLSD